MEIREISSGNRFDNVEIKCPYCFETFHHFDVGFRAAPTSEEKKAELRNLVISGSAEDGAKYKRMLENASQYDRRRDTVWHEYWNKMGWADNALLFENGDGYDEYDDHARSSALSDAQDIVIGLGNSSLIGEKRMDSDGFVDSVIDNRGIETTRRVCPHCHNKLPKDYGKNPVKFISLVGISGSGKTVMLSQLIENIEDYATLVGGSVTFDSSDSAKKFPLQYKVRANQELPSGTREHFSPPIFLQFSRTINGKINKSTLVVYDIAGESCISAGGIEKYGPFIRNSNGIILLLDPRQISAFSCADENAEKPQAVLNAMAGAFLLKQNQVCDVPLAVAYSKSDKLRNVGININENSHIFKPIDYKIQLSSAQRGFMLDSYKNVRFEVESMMKKYSITFYDKVLSLFKNYGFFAISALGHDTMNLNEADGAKGSVLTMNIEPIRLEEPLMWLLYKWKLINGVSNENDDHKHGLFSFLRRK